MRILITRPAEDGAQIAARLADMGHEGLVAPLLTPRYRAPGDPDFAEPDFTGVQAILITSANGVRALVHWIHGPASPFARSAQKGEVAAAIEAQPRGSEGRRGLFKIPVFAVGPQTAEEARQAGFADVRDSNGDAHTLAKHTAQWTSPEKGSLLHVCSREAPGTLANALGEAGFTVRPAALYRVEAATALPDTVLQALANGQLDAAMFFSPRSAAIFRECLSRSPDAMRLTTSLAASMTALCISAQTAAALAPLDFAATKIADRPNQDAMLALVV